MPSLGIYRRNHAVFGHSPGDAEYTVLVFFQVLTQHRRQ